MLRRAGRRRHRALPGVLRAPCCRVASPAGIRSRTAGRCVCQRQLRDRSDPSLRRLTSEDFLVTRRRAGAVEDRACAPRQRESTRASSTSEWRQRPPRRRPRSASAGSGRPDSLAERDAGPGVDVHRSGSTASGTRTHLTRNKDSDRRCGASRNRGTIALRAGASEKSTRSAPPGQLARPRRTSAIASVGMTIS